MGIFFSHARGAVRRVEGPWAAGGALRVSVQGWPTKSGGGMFNAAICTQAGISHQGNFQFLHTISNQIFVYIFGDRIAELTVAGVAFGTTCDNDSGVNEIIRQYSADRIALRGRPVVVVLGGISFQSFLTGFNVEITDPETQLAQFSYRFHSFPAET